MVIWVSLLVLLGYLNPILIAAHKSIPMPNGLAENYKECGSVTVCHFICNCISLSSDVAIRETTIYNQGTAASINWPLRSLSRTIEII